MNIKRYTVDATDENDNGEYVRYDDVKDLLDSRELPTLTDKFVEDCRDYPLTWVIPDGDQLPAEGTEVRFEVNLYSDPRMFNGWFNNGKFYRGEYGKVIRKCSGMYTLDEVNRYMVLPT